jgi:nucleoside 2-deoxyribosyltransferase
MKPRVYLSGPINGTTDCDQVWRKSAAQIIGDSYQVLDPLRRDCRNMKFTTVSSVNLVRQDLEEIDHAHVILANCAKPGWGTSMEIFYAHMKGKPILFFGAGNNPSPWLLAHARNLRTLQRACKELKKFCRTILECGA